MHSRRRPGACSHASEPWRQTGLGRTGTLVAAYMMRYHGFTAREAMGWLRIMRPGSVMGEQVFCPRQMHFFFTPDFLFAINFLGDPHPTPHPHGPCSGHGSPSPQSLNQTPSTPGPYLSSLAACRSSCLSSPISAIVAPISCSSLSAS
mmetsp:Transcript_52774/g.138842  ORF Transcript_52774/g.138842 Transcript_52774/m.138842 type:complete len:148 (-) Transcript_52774:114-557(-)